MHLTKVVYFYFTICDSIKYLVLFDTAPPPTCDRI
jgi:hypothetical protein